MRPANMLTAVADVLAGIAISGFFLQIGSIGQPYNPVVFLCVATACLYAGGIVFNDVFDAELDRVERPERPIPSGAISVRNASLLGTTLLIVGVIFGFLASVASGILAAGIAVFALIYDLYAKHHTWLGPMNMGFCRGLNLLLGLSIIPLALQEFFFVGLVPLIYIFAVTHISQGEVHGGKKKNLYRAGALYLTVGGSILWFAIERQTILAASLFILAFMLAILSPLAKAIGQPSGKNIGKAVKAGVISLIIMDAAWAATFGWLSMAFFILLLLPLSLWLAKIFAVT